MDIKTAFETLAKTVDFVTNITNIEIKDKLVICDCGEEPFYDYIFVHFTTDFEIAVVETHDMYTLQGYDVYRLDTQSSMYYKAQFL